MANPLMHENVWLHQQQFEEAESHYYKVLGGTAGAAAAPTAAPKPQAVQTSQGGGSSLKNEIAQTRQQIQNALSRPVQTCQNVISSNPQLQRRLDDLENENKSLKQTTAELRALIQRLESRVSALEETGGGDGIGAPSAPAVSEKKTDVKKDEEEDDDDDVDLFGDDDDDEELEALRKKRLEEYAEKKAKKPAVIAKSSVILDVKPWDDETDMQEMERLVRTIQMAGLVWGASKLVDLAYGIKKLQIMCVVEDEKVSVEDLREEIEKFEDVVQSVDIAAFNKI